MSLEQTEDLKAFERRLTEVITQLQPVAYKWRVILLSVIVLTMIGAWNWLTDPETSNVSLVQSLFNHPLFATMTVAMLFSFLFGIRQRICTPSVSLTHDSHGVASRCRQVLSDYNMSCDDTGKLILKPRPTTT